jgi:hypothetical protein
MNIAEYLEVTESHCRFLHPNTVSMVESVELMTRAIAFCRDQKITKLLVDACELTQLTPPTLVDRFLMVEDWAQAANGMVIVAMVWPPKLTHPQKFGIRVAAAVLYLRLRFRSPRARSPSCREAITCFDPSARG